MLAVVVAEAVPVAVAAPHRQSRLHRLGRLAHSEIERECEAGIYRFRSCSRSGISATGRAAGSDLRKA